MDPWVGKTPWRKKWQPTPAFLPGKSHGQRNLVGYSPWGCKELDPTEQLNTIPSCMGTWDPSAPPAWSPSSLLFEPSLALLPLILNCLRWCHAHSWSQFSVNPKICLQPRRLWAPDSYICLPSGDFHLDTPEACPNGAQYLPSLPKNQAAPPVPVLRELWLSPASYNPLALPIPLLLSSSTASFTWLPWNVM